VPTSPCGLFLLLLLLLLLTGHLAAGAWLRGHGDATSSLPATALTLHDLILPPGEEHAM
jgi:hypothetical protein